MVYHPDAFLLSFQSYDAQFLKIYPELPPTPLQLEEDLEQLKVLENGYKMKVLFIFSLSCSIPSSIIYHLYPTGYGIEVSCGHMCTFSCVCKREKDITGVSKSLRFGVN